MSNSLQPHGLQHARLPCPSPIIGAYSFYVYQVGDAIQPAHPSPLLLLPSILAASGSFLMNQFFASGGQNIKSFSFSISPSNNIQDWFPLGLNAWISLQSKGLWRVFSNTTVQKHQFFGAQLSYRKLIVVLLIVVPTDCSEWGRVGEYKYGTHWKKEKRDCVHWLEQDRGRIQRSCPPVCVPREHFSSLLYVRVKLDAYLSDCCFNISRVRLFHFVINYLWSGPWAGWVLALEPFKSYFWVFWFQWMQAQFVFKARCLGAHLSGTDLKNWSAGWGV